jgi:hypothetical protein
MPAGSFEAPVPKGIKGVGYKKERGMRVRRMRVRGNRVRGVRVSW